MNILRDKNGRFIKGNRLGDSLSREHKDKISKANTGKKVSEETRKRISKAHKGKKLSEKAKKKLSDFWKGKKKSKTHIENIRKAKLGDKNPMFGKKRTKNALRKFSLAMKGKEFTEEHKLNLRKIVRRGKDSNFWKGGVSSENIKIRASLEYKLWRESVFVRDNWICQKCNRKGYKLNAHHICNFADYIELRTSIENGITFCEKCHIKFHKVYGTQNNTKEQLNEFLIDKQ